MSYTGFRLTGANAVAIRPADKPQTVAGDTWARDKSSPSANDGTEIDATWVNRIRASLEAVVTALGGDLADGDNQVANAVIDYVAAQIAAIEIDIGNVTGLTGALAAKAPLASPTFTGTPAAPTATPGTNTTQLATTAFVIAAVNALINAAPGVLDTLDELAAALGDDANFAATMTTALALKAPLASPNLTGVPAAPTASQGNNGTQIATTAFAWAILNGAEQTTASASTTDINAFHIKYVVTGTTTITAFSVASNAFRVLRFAGALTLTHNATSLILPGGANITTAAGDVAILVSDGSGNWRCISYLRASGLPVSLASAALTGTPTAPTASPGANTTQVATTAYVQSEIALLPFASYAPLADPALTGVPTAPTATIGSSSTQIATTAYAWGMFNGAEATVASAATANIGTAASIKVGITGTTTITSFGSTANAFRVLRFAGALTLTHNATSLILPGGANITTAAGDVAFVMSDASGNWRCISYLRASGLPLSSAVALLNTPQSWTAQQQVTIATLTDAAGIDWNVTSAQKAQVTLGGNRTMNAVSNAGDGATYTLWVIQDGTGGRTITWTTSGTGSFDFGADGPPVLSTTANKADLLAFEAITIGGTRKLRFMGIKKGFG